MNSYEKTYTITTNMNDKNDRLKPSSILDICQIIAGEHAETFNAGFLDFVNKGYYWVIVRNYVECVKDIKDMREVKVVTYPEKPRFVEMPRDTEIYYKDELVYKIRTIWMIFDFKNNSVADPIIVTDIDTSHEPLFNTRFRRLVPIVKEKLTLERKQEVTFSYLDHNGHMNNTRYLDLYLDVFKDNQNKPFKNLQVEYSKQCYEGEMLELYSYKEEDGNYLFGYCNDELRFYMKVTY